jgi:dihydroorotate dehydrogenase electron transfer subunit
MLKNVVTTIVSNKAIANRIYELVLQSDEADLVHFVPGQFANIDIPNRSDLLLKRPISINKVDVEQGLITLVYQPVGQGTQALLSAQPGEKIKSILPIGRGFNLKASDKTVFLVGGGVGIAPLLPVTKKWPDRDYHAFLGYRSKDCTYCSKDFQAVSDKTYISSDDGTVGIKGFVTDSLSDCLLEVTPDVVLSCGPGPMLKSLKAAVGNIPTQVSLEQRMCCGFGACAVCVCAINNGAGLDYKKACIEGPVFDLNEVVL